MYLTRHLLTSISCYGCCFSENFNSTIHILLHILESLCTPDYFCLQNASTKENDTLLAVGTGYLQGEDVASRGRVLLFAFGKSNDSTENLVSSLSLVVCILFCVHEIHVPKFIC